jgi:hypothetical protein
LARPRPFDAVLIDELFYGANTLALFGASLC